MVALLIVLLATHAADAIRSGGFCFAAWCHKDCAKVRGDVTKVCGRCGSNFKCNPATFGITPEPTKTPTWDPTTRPPTAYPSESPTATTTYREWKSHIEAGSSGSSHNSHHQQPSSTSTKDYSTAANPQVKTHKLRVTQSRHAALNVCEDKIPSANCKGLCSTAGAKLCQKTCAIGPCTQDGATGFLEDQIYAIKAEISDGNFDNAGKLKGLQEKLQRIRSSGTSNTKALLPSPHPTIALTSRPSPHPTILPTMPPTFRPTVFHSPTGAPSMRPTSVPLTAPTSSPSASPTISPTLGPSTSPTTVPTLCPSPSPTNPPVADPTPYPSQFPTAPPSSSPSASPTNAPTPHPSKAPVQAPTLYPSSAPSNTPTLRPSKAPVQAPTMYPSSAPSNTPTLRPSKAPVNAPTQYPTNFPTTPYPSPRPTAAPTHWPSRSPTTGHPTLFPTNTPTRQPSAYPTNAPTSEPTSSGDSGYGAFATRQMALKRLTLVTKVKIGQVHVTNAPTSYPSVPENACHRAMRKYGCVLHTSHYTESGKSCEQCALQHMQVLMDESCFESEIEGYCSHLTHKPTLVPTHKPNAAADDDDDDMINM